MSHPLLPTTIDLLRELVSYNTEPSLSNIPLVASVERYLQSHQLSFTTRLDETGEKVSLLSHIGPQVDGGVILSGHTDVVDALSQVWTTPAFDLSQRNNKLFARGSCDMKGFVACILAQAPSFAKAKLKRPIYISLSRDEEIGSLGMEDMLNLISETKMKPAVAIVGEPTQMEIVAGHKAGYEMRTRFMGTAAHSSLPDSGSSATVPAARFACFLSDLSAQMKSSPDKESPFFPPYGIINIGILKGGVARNIVADECEVQWHYRPLPNEDADAIITQARQFAMETLLPQMQANGHKAEIQFITDAAYPGLIPNPHSQALQLVQTLLQTNHYTVAPYGADSGYFQQGGIDAVLVGPGNIAQAHKPDEFIEIEQIEECLFFLDKLRSHLEEDLKS